MLSSTALKPGQSTRGHAHPGQEEVYYFISGVGTMELNDKKFNVQGGDVVLIEDGVFHRVHNGSGSNELYFVCVFDGKRNH
jgi:mannose-6-phosphate isomerase-like protein (cupin superfamily)